MTAARASRDNVSPRVGPAPIGAGAGVPKENAGKPTAADAGLTRKALALLVGELKAAIRDQGAEIALLRAQVASLLEPAPVPAGYVALKVAAHALGCSDEWLRKRCKRGEIDCRQAVPDGPWYVRLGGTLARANSANREIVRP
jgi:hypothetical protein